MDDICRMLYFPYHNFTFIILLGTHNSMESHYYFHLFLVRKSGALPRSKVSIL